MNFYSVIIGTELLNGRRKDAHFSFLNNELLKRGWEQKASFVIKDEPPFIEDIFRLIKNDPDAVLFCFGGIGSTPDDYTRPCAANVFTDAKMEVNQNALECIVEQFGEEAYPHRIHMADLPINAKQLKNVVNNVPGFSLEGRYFFTPGFPSMSQSMVVEALDTFFPKNKEKYRYFLKADCSENDLIGIMRKIPDHIDFSSLPQIKDNNRSVVISVASYDDEEAKMYFSLFENLLIEKKIVFTLEDK
ncbi:molybdopterin-binding protein [Arcobacteraceae bacterium]|nr:molybdopterin-binding protein [Arcobacteraceae bacterium]